jgi:type II secretory pathway component PulF
MTIEYAEPTLQSKRNRFDPEAAFFAAVWIGLLVVPPVLYRPMVETFYSEMKTELPGITEVMLAFGRWNSAWWWTWTAVPALVGWTAHRLSPDPVETLANLRWRQERLYWAMILTLVGLFIAIVQMVILWMPWITILQSVSGDGRK